MPARWLPGRWRLRSTLCCASGARCRNYYYCCIRQYTRNVECCVGTSASRDEASSLPLEPAASAHLVEQLKNLSIHPPQLQPSSSQEERINGLTYKLDDNQFALDTFSISFNNNEAAVTLQFKTGEDSVICLGRGNGSKASHRSLMLP